jgi:hypothetical protein
VINFGGVKVGSSLTKSIDVDNTSDRAVSLRSVTIKGDQSVCKFRTEVARKEADDVIATIDSHGSYNLKVRLLSTRLICKYKQFLFQLRITI